MTKKPGSLIDLKLDPKELAFSRMAVLGIPDSGKTVTAKNLAEMMMAAAIPITALDPAGNWRFLKVPAKGGRGFPAVVVGGAAADITLQRPEQAAEIMRAAMQRGISVIFDLYDAKLSKGDWRRIVETVATVLYYENKPHGLRHLFIEEAAEFVPQTVRGDVAKVYGVLEKVARMGRNAGLGLTLINQRAEEVNKAVLELCDLLFLHRQKGRRSLQNLSKWLDFAEVEDREAIMTSVPGLGQGECWAWIGDHAPAHIKVPMTASYHPNVRALAGDVKMPDPVNVNDWIEDLKAALAPKAPPAKKVAPAAAAVPDQARVDRAYQDGFAAGFRAGAEAMKHAAAFIADAATTSISAEVHRITERAIIAGAKILKLPGQAPAAAPGSPRTATPGPRTAKPASGLPAGTGNGAELGQGPRRILTAVAQNHGLTQEGIAVITGYRKTSRAEYVRQLRLAGYIKSEGATLHATESGLAALGDFEPLPEGQELLEYWLKELDGGPQKILRAIVDAGELTSADIQEVTGYKKTSVSEFVRQLKQRQLIVTESGLHSVHPMMA